MKDLFSVDNLQYLQDEFQRLEFRKMDATIRVLGKAQQAVVNSCSMCSGQGYTVETRTTDEHNCGGDQNVCEYLCPVQVEQQVAEQCEYCGRPSAAIQELVQKEEENLANYKAYIDARMHAVAENLKRVANGDDSLNPVDND